MKKTISTGLLLAAACAFLVWRASPVLGNDPDFFWHLKAGEATALSGSVPRQDPFSFTAKGADWVAHEWLWELGLYRLLSLGGFRAVALCQAALAGAASYLVWLEAVSLGASSPGATLAGALFGAFSAGFYAPRPQGLSYLLFALFVRFSRSGRNLWLLPPLAALWSNCHGSFVLAPALAGFFALARRDKKLIFACAACALFCALNPRGFELYRYALWVSSHGEMKSAITEWHPPDFHDPWMLAAYGVPLALALFFSKKKPPLSDRLLAFGALLAALSSARFLPYFLAASVPAVASSAFGGGKPSRAPAWLLLPAALPFLAFPAPARIPVDPRQYPVAAVEHVGLRPFNLYEWGGYLIFRNAPVFVDGRADVYLKTPVWRDYLDAVRLRRDPEEIFQKYTVDSVLMPPDHPLSVHLRALPEWEEVHRDETASVFRRSPSCLERRMKP